LIKFDNYKNLAAWRESDAELKWLSEHSNLVQKPADMQIWERGTGLLETSNFGGDYSLPTTPDIESNTQPHN